MPFELGRPFGAPNEPAFQRRVLTAVLNLLERTDGPIIEDFPDAAPGGAQDSEGWTCPVNLAPPPADLSDSGKLVAAMEGEIALLRPWFEESLKASGGRTLMGDFSKLKAEDIARFVIDYMDDPGMESPVAGTPLALAVKYATDDLRFFYFQSMLAKPGGISDLELGNWYFGDTVAGKVICMLSDFCLAQDDPAVKRLGIVQLVPYHQRHRVENP